MTTPDRYEHEHTSSRAEPPAGALAPDPPTLAEAAREASRALFAALDATAGDSWRVNLGADREAIYNTAMAVEAALARQEDTTS